MPAAQRKFWYMQKEFIYSVMYILAFNLKVIKPIQITVISIKSNTGLGYLFLGFWCHAGIFIYNGYTPAIQLRAWDKLFYFMVY